jgi:hypothetical protein
MAMRIIVVGPGLSDGPGHVRGSLQVQTHVQRAEHRHDGLKPRMGAGRERLIKAFAAEPGRFRHLRHAARLGYVGESQEQDVEIGVFSCGC